MCKSDIWLIFVNEYANWWLKLLLLLLTLKTKLCCLLCYQSSVVNTTLLRSVKIHNTVWHCVTVCGTVWHSVTVCNTVYVYIRARWISKLLKIKTGHMYSYVKLNFKASLFSCIFWFEAIFRCKTALLVFWPSNWENGSKTVRKMRKAKIGSKPTQKW